MKLGQNEKHVLAKLAPSFMMNDDSSNITDFFTSSQILGKSCVLLISPYVQKT